VVSGEKKWNKLRNDYRIWSGWRSSGVGRRIRGGEVSTRGFVPTR
jgi:hypothetical protein